MWKTLGLGKKGEGVKDLALLCFNNRTVILLTHSYCTGQFNSQSSASHPDAFLLAMLPLFDDCCEFLGVWNYVSDWLQYIFVPWLVMIVIGQVLAPLTDQKLHFNFIMFQNSLFFLPMPIPTVELKARGKQGKACFNSKTSWTRRQMSEDRRGVIRSQKQTPLRVFLSCSLFFFLRYHFLRGKTLRHVQVKICGANAAWEEQMTLKCQISSSYAFSLAGKESGWVLSSNPSLTGCGPAEPLLYLSLSQFFIFKIMETCLPVTLRCLWGLTYIKFLKPTQCSARHRLLINFGFIPYFQS